ncbi:transcription factor bHLH30-like [Olea europaea var. sylvestris]|uniref:transcription factor bHLH30-like n=1 Tax=Olea europaea var. sylvestris TaxID=158386 RepID=UPI000C1D363C|nr:transcription factor bHLH30-like [Olea europaea var. sylvestris]
MYSIPSLYELGNCSDFLQTETSNLENQNLSPRSMAEAKAVAANNSHKEAERRRRKRINAHIATLKTILPNTIKTDKASLLAEAVRRVRELKKTTAELAAIEEEGEKDTDHDMSNTKSKFIFPSETDELKVTYCDDNSGLIKANICCDDRPEIILELIQALKSVKGKVMKAEMATVGGRIKSILWVQILGSIGNEDSLGTLRRALKVVMDKSTLLAGSGHALPGNKRPRCYHF